MNRFFPLSRFVNVREAYEPAKMDNAYHTFTAGGLDWLVISSELDPRPGVLTWFNKVVTEHPDHNVIYTTHNYLAPNGNLAGAVGYGDLSPQAVWDGLIKLHANIRFVLSGHLTQTAFRQTPGNSGDTVYQILTDYQDDGNGWVRTLLIDPDAKTVTSQVYSPYLKVFKTGPTEAFTIANVKLVPARRSPGLDVDGGTDSGASAGGAGGTGASAGAGVRQGSSGAGAANPGAGGAATSGGTGSGGTADGRSTGGYGRDASVGNVADGAAPRGQDGSDEKSGCGCRLILAEGRKDLATLPLVALLVTALVRRRSARSNRA